MTSQRSEQTVTDTMQKINCDKVIQNEEKNVSTNK